MLPNRIENAVEGYQTLREIDLSYRALQTADEGISLATQDWMFSYVNPAFRELFGYGVEQLVGANWTIMYHNEGPSG